MGRWEDICEPLREQGVSNEEQAAPQFDMLDYLKLWRIKDAIDIRHRWVYHPDEAVKCQLESELQEKMDTYDLFLDDVLECLEDLYRFTKLYEKPVATIDEAEEIKNVFGEIHDYRRYTRKMLYPPWG